IRLKLAADANVDHTPAHHWPDPTVAGAPRLEAGPIMIQVEYCVDPPNAEAVRGAMAELRRQRRRPGAAQGGPAHATADPSRFVETWVESTWAEHLRYHERVSVAHQEVERRAQALVRSGSPITTRHFIAPVERPSDVTMVQSVEARTSG